MNLKSYLKAHHLLVIGLLTAAALMALIFPSLLKWSILLAMVAIAVWGLLLIRSASQRKDPQVTPQPKPAPNQPPTPPA